MNFRLIYPRINARLLKLIIQGLSSGVPTLKVSQKKVGAGIKIHELKNNPMMLSKILRTEMRVITKSALWGKRRKGVFC